MRRIRILVVIAGLVLVAGAITAYAAIPDASGTIHSCYSQATGTWRPIDTETTPQQNCKKGEMALNWGATGPVGPPGANGANGVEDAYYTEARDEVDLGASWTKILTLSLPAGNWSVSANVLLGNFSGERVPVLCALWTPTGNLPGDLTSATALTSFPGTGGDTQTLPVSAMVTFQQPGDIWLQCMSNTGDGGAQAFADGRQITALGATNIHVQP